MVNLINLKKGQRIKLLAPLRNPNSAWKPEEDIPVGTLGTVVWPCDKTTPLDFVNVGVHWDNGSHLGILGHDVIELVVEKKDDDDSSAQAAAVS